MFLFFPSPPCSLTILNLLDLVNRSAEGQPGLRSEAGLDLDHAGLGSTHTSSDVSSTQELVRISGCGV